MPESTESSIPIMIRRAMIDWVREHAFGKKKNAQTRRKLILLEVVKSTLYHRRPGFHEMDDLTIEAIAQTIKERHAERNAALTKSLNRVLTEDETIGFLEHEIQAEEKKWRDSR